MYPLLEYGAFVLLVLLFSFVLFVAAIAFILAQEGVRKVATAAKQLVARGSSGTRKEPQPSPESSA